MSCPAALERPATSPLRIEAVTADEPGWAAFVAGSPDASYCHLAGWRHIMRDVLGHECLYLAALDADGTWRGALPLVRVRSRLLGHYLVSMPFLSEGGPLGSPAARRGLAERAALEARRCGADLLELRARRPLQGTTLDGHTRRITVLLDLPDSPETLWRSFRSKVRSQIRRPMKEGMEVRFGPEEMAAFYLLLARNMRDLGTPVLPRAWFEAIARVFPELLVVGVVYRDGTPVAGGCGFAWRGELDLMWAASLREHSAAAPNMLLYWSFMERAVEKGLGVFNFGRCSPGSGTHRFKLQWGGREAPLPWSQWSARGVRATPSRDRPGFQLATRAWQRLPLPVANRLGPYLSRCLP